jgi:hypothetical protein
VDPRDAHRLLLENLFGNHGLEDRQHGRVTLKWLIRKKVLRMEYELKWISGMSAGNNCTEPVGFGIIV